MAQTYTVRAELPGDYYHAIGAVANKWALLEYLMGKMIRAILDVDHKSARCLTGGMTARALGGTLKNLATLHITDKTLCAEVIAYQKEVCEHEDRRNEFVHCVWGVPEGAPDELTLLIARSASQRLMPDGEPLTHEQVLYFAHVLSHLVEKGDLLVVRVRDWRATQPQPSPQQDPEP